MGALNIPAAVFSDAHGLLTDAADLEDWPTTAPRPLVTEAELDDMAEKIADTGYFDDELGKQKKASQLLKACCIDYVDDPMKLPGYTLKALEVELTAIINLGKFGK